MRVLKTFFGFILGAFLASMGLNYYRTGSIQMEWVLDSLNPFILGASIGLLLIVAVMAYYGRKK